MRARDEVWGGMRRGTSLINRQSRAEKCTSASLNRYPSPFDIRPTSLSDVISRIPVDSSARYPRAVNSASASVAQTTAINENRAPT